VLDRGVRPRVAAPRVEFRSGLLAQPNLLGLIQYKRRHTKTKLLAAYALRYNAGGVGDYN